MIDPGIAPVRGLDGRGTAAVGPARADADQVKALPVATARPLENGDPTGMGAGVIDVLGRRHLARP